MLERRPQAGPDLLTTDVPLLERPTGGDPEPVRLERDDRLVKGEARDRRADVRSAPGELRELARGPREDPVPGADDLAGGGTQVPRPGVVSGPLPRLQDVVLRRARERRDGRVFREEREVPRDDGGDPRLLEEHLGDPDPVRVAVGAPREGPTVEGEPGEEPVRAPGPRPAPNRRRTGHRGAGRNEGLKPACGSKREGSHACRRIRSSSK